MGPGEHVITNQPYYILLCLMQEATTYQLNEAMQVLMGERQELAFKAALSTLSLNRLNQRLTILERLFIALSHQETTEGSGYSDVDGSVTEKQESGVGLSKSVNRYVYTLHVVLEPIQCSHICTVYAFI